MEPAYKSMRTTVCAECRKQHVLADGIPVCGHVSTDSGKMICRRCWGKLEVRKKYSGATYNHLN